MAWASASETRTATKRCQARRAVEERERRLRVVFAGRCSTCCAADAWMVGSKSAAACETTGMLLVSPSMGRNSSLVAAGNRSEAERC